MMIPATVVCYAKFKHTIVHAITGKEHTYWDYKRVLMWDDDCNPYVFDNGERQLVLAGSFRNFDGLSETGSNEFVSLTPSGGWCIRYTSDKEGVWTEPIVGWGLQENGNVTALITDGDGTVSSVDSFAGEWTIYHPDSKTESE